MSLATNYEKGVVGAESCANANQIKIFFVSAGFSFLFDFGLRFIQNLADRICLYPAAFETVSEQ